MHSKYRILFVPLVLLAIGCATAPALQPAANSKSPFDTAAFGGETTQLAKPTPGAEAFRAYYQGGTGFISLTSVRETVEDFATKHCARDDKTVRVLQERSSTPPHILGNFPRVEWVFECALRATAKPTDAPPPDKLAQIERLKKLFDSGALTQQEFDREKAKLLNTP